MQATQLNQEAEDMISEYTAWLNTHRVEEFGFLVLRSMYDEEGDHPIVWHDNTLFTHTIEPIRTIILTADPFHEGLNVLIGLFERWDGGWRLVTLIHRFDSRDTVIFQNGVRQ